MNEELYMPYAYIKLMPGADKGNVLLYIRNMLNELSPSCLPDFEFCDTFSRHLYEKEIQFGDRVILSSVLSIWMALAGILSLVLFDVHYQRREIGIRRVYGSSGCECFFGGTGSYPPRNSGLHLNSLNKVRRVPRNAPWTLIASIA